MLSIDEAIVHAREVASRKFDDRIHCIRCSEFHRQLAEWLEELKAYREKKCNKSVYLASKSVDKIDVVNKGYIDGYNKAIDEFAENISLKISDSFIWGKIADCFKSKNINDTSDEIIVYIINTANEIAEQLKENI